jgi:hypothetical protein
VAELTYHLQDYKVTLEAILYDMLHNIYQEYATNHSIYKDHRHIIELQQLHEHKKIDTLESLHSHMSSLVDLQSFCGLY